MGDMLLAGIALLMLWYALVTVFWLTLWFALQPVRLVLWAIMSVRVKTTTPTRAALPSNVIRFPRERRAG